MGPVGKGSGEEPLTAPEVMSSPFVSDEGASVKASAGPGGRRRRRANKLGVATPIGEDRREELDRATGESLPICQELKMDGETEVDVVSLTFGLGPLRGEVVIAGVSTMMTQACASPERQFLVNWLQKSYDQLVREAKRLFAPKLQNKGYRATNRAHCLAAREYQETIDCYQRLLYRDIDPVGSEVRIPKRATLRRPELADLEIVKIQDRIPGAEVCAGLVSTWTAAGVDSGLVEPRLAADVDPAARAEYIRKFPKARVKVDCREITADQYTGHLIQVVQASVPCTPWTRGGGQLGRAAEEGNLLDHMIPSWRFAFEGDGVPIIVVECTLGFEKLAFETGEVDLRGYVATRLPGHHVSAGVTEAEKIPSPLDGERCVFVKRQWWIIAVSRAFFDAPIPAGSPTGAIATGVAADIIDTDMDRAQGYWFMPAIDAKNLREVGREIGGTFRVANIAEKPSNLGTAGFPSKVTDPNFGNAPTITTGSRGGWITDVITGRPVIRQWTLRELARGCRIREGGINPSYLANDSAVGTRALAMCVPQNVADEVLVRVIRAYTTPGRDGSTPEERFLSKHGMGEYAGIVDRGNNVPEDRRSSLEIVDVGATEPTLDQVEEDDPAKDACGEFLSSIIEQVTQAEVTRHVGVFSLSVVDLAVQRWRLRRPADLQPLPAWEVKWPMGRNPGCYRAERRQYDKADRKRAALETLAVVPEELEGVDEEMLFTATMGPTGACMMVYVSKGDDGNWGCPLVKESGTRQYPWLSLRDDPKRWMARRTEAVSATWDERSPRAGGMSCEVEGRAVYVSDPEAVVDVRGTPMTDALKTHLCRRDPDGLVGHRAQWVPVQELLDSSPQWEDQRQGERMRWLALEAGAWLGRERNTHLEPEQQGCLLRIIEAYKAGQSEMREHYSQMVGKVVKECSLPATGLEASVVPVTVGFTDYIGRGVKLPKLAAGEWGRNYQISPCQVTCAAKGLATPYGVAPPGARMVTLHVANHSGHHQHLMAGETLCMVDGVRERALGEDRGVTEGTYEWLDKMGVDVSSLVHATDLPSSWRGRRVVLNHAGNLGDLASQAAACRWAGAKNARELLVLQTVRDPAVLQPWRDAGYRVEMAPMRDSSETDAEDDVGFTELRETAKGPHWRRWRRGRGRLYAIWKDDRKSQELAVLALRAELEGEVLKRRMDLIQQRKELTGDDKHQFPEGAERTKIVDQMFEPFMPLFDPDNLGQTEGAECEIDTGDAEPVVNQPYRLSPNERDIIRAEVSKMLRLGVVRPSQSPWGSLPVLARKPDGSVRFCIDYRAVNKVTKPDAMPIPRIDDTLAALQGAKYFTTMDAMSGFWQVPVKEGHIEKTAFLTVEGSYEFVRMPFGLRNAPACFQRLMNRVLAGLTWKTCLIYIDDCTIYSPTFDQHVKDVAEVLGRFRDSGVTLKMSKCRFFVSEMDFLGHVVSGEGIRPSPKKVAAIQEVKLPTNISELRGFLGLTGWFRKFIKDYARIALPLTQLTKKENRKRIREEMQGQECRTAIKRLKEALIGDDVMLIHPDFNKKFRVDLDASENQIGGVLLQHDEEQDAWRPIEYLSKKFTRELKDQGFAPTHLEAMALQACVDRWRPYLIDRCFDLVTDHTALKSLPTRKMDQNLLTRHQLLMQPFNYNIVYRPGSIHHVPDGLSRLPKEDNPEEELPVRDYGDQIPTLEAERLLSKAENGMASDGSRSNEPTEPMPPAGGLPDGDTGALAEVTTDGSSAAAAPAAAAPCRVVVMCVVTDLAAEPVIMTGRVTRSQARAQEESESAAMEEASDEDPDLDEPITRGSLWKDPATKVVEGSAEPWGPGSDDMEGMDLLETWAGEVDSVPTELGLNDEQAALLLSLRFDGWRDLQENLQCTDSQVGNIRAWVRDYWASAVPDLPEEGESSFLNTRLEEELEVEFLNDLTNQKSEVVEGLAVPDRLKKKLFTLNFDDWEDVREECRCSEEELEVIQTGVRAAMRARNEEALRSLPQHDTEVLPPGFPQHGVHFGTPQDPGLDVPNDEKLAQMQKDDPWLRAIINYCKDHDGAEAPKQWGTDRPMARGQLEQFRLGRHHDLLLRTVYAPPGALEKRREREERDAEGLLSLRNRREHLITQQRVIPEGSLREVLLYYYHGHRLHLHMGVESTLAQMQKAVWWPGMREDVINYHASCVCVKNGRYPNGVGSRVRLVAPRGRLKSTLTAPHQLLYMDHKSLPPTAEGYKAVLVMVDGFSGFIQLAPQRSLTAEETSRAVVERWLQPFGHTDQIHADGAPSFTGEVIAEVNRFLGVRQSRIIPHNPRGNSLAEGTVRRVKVALTNLVTRAPREWVMFLPFVSMALNDNVSLDTGLAPITLHLGKLPQGRISIEVPYRQLPSGPPAGPADELCGPRARETPVQYAKRWTLRIQEVLQEVCRQLSAEKHQELNRGSVADRHATMDLALPEPGDLVYYWKEQLHSRIQSEKQLYDPWMGPYLVKRILHGGKAIVVQMDEEERVAHPRQLRKYLGPLSGSYPTAGSGFVWGRPVEVLAHRRRGTDDEYLTRYLNHYAEVQEWTSWQLLSPRLIQNFLHDLHLNRHKEQLRRGVRAAVWWPAQRRSKWGVIAERKARSNLITLQYDDGEWGDAYVNMQGRILTAEETSFDPNTDRAKPRGIRSARQEVQRTAGDETERPRRRMGYQLAQSLPY